MWGYKDETVTLNLDVNDLRKLAKVPGKDWVLTKIKPEGDYFELKHDDDTVVRIEFTRTVNHKL